MPSPRTDLDDNTDPPAADAPLPEPRRTMYPNYLFRRAVAVGGVVAMIATAAIVVGRLVGDDSPATDSGAASEEWNRVVSIDERTGMITIDDANGDEQLEITTGVRSLTGAEIVDSTMVATSPTQVAVIDLIDESVQTVELQTNEIGVTRPSGSALTLISSDTSAQRAVMVYGPTGDQLDTDEMAGSAGARYEFQLARSDPSGRQVLVTDSGNFQSVLFSFDRDTAAFFPGLALAVDETYVVTTQNVGNDATVSMFDHDGELFNSGTTSSVRAAMIVDDAVVLVTVEGEIVQLSKASADTRSGATLDIGTIEVGHVTTSGDRLIVVGTTGTAIIDGGGSILGEFPNTRLSENGLDQFAPRRSNCLLLLRNTGSEVVLIDMADGSTIAEAPISETFLATADGCTVAAQTASDYSLISASGAVSASFVGDLIAFAPDGTMIATDQDQRLLLTPVMPETDPDDPQGTDGPADGIDIGRSGRRVSFTQL